ncbi:MAG: amidohydrolase family protein [Candidatus Aminicenantes bacterium]|nr:amidohydrolase family protein [Candidatus Aminicenantes bacterium]
MSGKRLIKVFFSTFVTILWISLSSISPAQDASSLKAIAGVTLVNTDGKKPIKNAVILVEGSTIKKVGTAEKVKIPKDAEIINAEGKWIIPGLVDAHIHFFQSGGLYTRPDVIDLRKFVPYEEEELAQIRENLPDTFARYMRCGITSAVDVGGPFWNYDVRELARKTKLAPRIAVAGPLISTYQPKALTTGDPPIIKVNSVEEARDLVRRQVEKKTDFIKIWYIVRSSQKPEDHLPLVKATIQESHKHGLRVIVHATQLETARTAVKAGADILAHIVTDKEVDEEFIRLLKENNVILTPTLIVFEGYSEVLSQQVELCTPEFEYANPYIVSTFFDLRELPTDAIPKRVLERMNNTKPISPNPAVLKNLKLLQEGGVTIAAGTDAGNIGTLHGPSIFREFELMAEAGLSPLQILTAATINGAKFTGWQEKLGTIEAGKLADMVILNSDPLLDIQNTSDIHLVIKDGMIFEPAQIIRKKPEDVVQQQVNAYNARDLDAFLATYSPSIKLYDHPNKLRWSGLEEMREPYANRFESSPRLHCEIVNRIVLGNSVIDREKITGLPDARVINAVVIYEVQEGLIQRVWFLRE